MIGPPLSTVKMFTLVGGLTVVVAKNGSSTIGSRWKR
jgi:hypothetical protein